LFFWLLAVLIPGEAYDLVHMGGQECSKPDLITGFIHLKNKRITWKQEGFSSGKTNSFGFLDSEHQIAKPPGVCRIAMLGDSQTESLQVPQEARFSNRLEQRLNAITPGKFEVLNFGISAAGTGQEYLTYLRYVEQFKPNVTILFYDSGDEDKNERKPAMSQWHPHVVFGLENEKLTVSWRDFDSWLHSAQAMPIALFEEARSNSHFWGTLLQSFNVLQSDLFFSTGCIYLDRWKILGHIEDLLVQCLPLSRFGPSDFRQSPAEIQAKRGEFCSQFGLNYADAGSLTVPKFDREEYEFGREAEYHTRVLTPEQTEKMKQRYRERWQVTLAILKRFSDECKRNGSKFVVVGFPPQLLKEGFGRTFTQITTLAEQQKFYAVDITPYFDAAANAKKISPRYVTHLTPAGHDVMADLLYMYLAQHKILSLNGRIVSQGTIAQ
jgi:hypothetical protein